MRRTGFLALAVALPLGLAACSSQATGDSGRSSTRAPEGRGTPTIAAPGPSRTPQPTWATGTPPDRWVDPRAPAGTPIVGTSNRPTPTDVTPAQISTWLREGRLPPAPAHGLMFEAMTTSIRERPAPDIMIFGDSMTQQGIDPVTLSRLLSPAVGREVTAFNASSSRARWGVNRLAADYAISIGKAPKIALVGISTRAAEKDVAYDDAKITPFAAMVQGCDERIGAEWTAADEAQCERYVKDPNERWARAGDQIRVAKAGKKAPTSVKFRADGLDWLQPDGFMNHPGMSTGDVLASSRKRAERFPGWPNMDPEGKAAFDAFVDDLERAGVTVITFEIPYSPVHQRTLEGISNGQYDKKRQKAAADLVAGTDVHHFPVTSYGDWWSDGDSRDEIHLAPNGAKKFTKQIVEMPGFEDAAVDALR